MFELEEIRGHRAKIKVVGIGGAGGNVVNNMISSVKGVEYVVVNTDVQDLETSMAGTKVQIGRAVTRGLGAGSRPDTGRQAALEDRDGIAEALKGADMIFITAGMGGGTGTGASPVIAGIARELGALTVAIVTKPFYYEGRQRMLNAEAGLGELEKNADTLIVISNDRIKLVVEKGTSLIESFSIANNVLKHAVRGISDLVLRPGLINLDFADVRTALETAGSSVMGMGVAKGQGRGLEASKKAISNPLIENSSIEGARKVLINVTGGLDLSLDDIEEASALVYDSADKEAHIIMGTTIDPDISDEVRVTVIATGFSPEAKAKAGLMTKSRPLPRVTLRASERVLAKSLVAMHEGMPCENPLDIPTFLRRHGQIEL
jgi:cell division protein FtsZ